MNVWIRRTLQVGIVSAGLVLAGAAAAQAHDLGDMTTIGNGGIANGIQDQVPIQIPTNIRGQR